MQMHLEMGAVVMGMQRVGGRVLGFWEHSREGLVWTEGACGSDGGRGGGDGDVLMVM